MKRKSNSQRNLLFHQHGRCFIVFLAQFSHSHISACYPDKISFHFCLKCFGIYHISDRESPATSLPNRNKNQTKQDPVPHPKTACVFTIQPFTHTLPNLNVLPLYNLPPAPKGIYPVLPQAASIWTKPPPLSLHHTNTNTPTLSPHEAVGITTQLPSATLIPRQQVLPPNRLYPSPQDAGITTVQPINTYV